MPHLPYLGGIDGLRALSVVAVILYHLPWSVFSGGFFGVEVFFVISGYLITSLLIGEQRRTGGISLRDFWIRRARRLLPALYLLLAVVVLAAALFASDAVARLRGDVPAALLYVSNWWQLIDQRSYFELAGRPPLLQHLWSLAIEEQFYVVWPLVFAFAVTRLHKRSLLLVTGATAAASAVLMAVLYTPSTTSDSTGLYFNSFTRLSGLLGGCALAMIWRPDRLRRRPKNPAVGTAMDAVGVLGLVVLGVMFTAFDSNDSFVFRGGFTVVDLATIAVIMSVVHPDGRLGNALGTQPLQWIGLRSYGLYLWHFPIFAMTRPQLDVDLGTVPLTVLRLALTLAVTELSFRFVEKPIRNGAIGRWRDRPVFARTGRVRRRVQIVGLSLVPLSVLGVLVLDRSESGADKVQREIAEASRAAEDAPLLTVATTSTTAAPTTTALPTETTTIAPETVPETTLPPGPAPAAPGLVGVPDPPPTTPPNPGLPVTPVAVSAIGDSVMQGAANVLRKNIPGIAVNAERSRQFGTVIEVMQGMAMYNTLGHVVLIHLGTNGTITERMIDKVMEIAGPARQVYFVTPKVPRVWEAEDNAQIQAAPARHPNAYVIDWYNASKDNPALFVSDGAHLTAPGILAYVQLILNSFN